MGSKDHTETGQSYSDPYEDYDDMEDELDTARDDFKDLPKAFQSTDPKRPLGRRDRLSIRREIEKRNELKELHKQFDDWDELTLGSDWEKGLI